MKINIRPEKSADYPSVRKVIERAFDRSDEADLVEKLRRAAPLYISLIAERGGEIIGHIFFTPVSIEPPGDEPLKAFGLAPLAVLPEFQNQGVGIQLTAAGLEECRRRNVEAVVVLGHPNYYPRFGFLPASRKHLKCEFPVPDEVFMVLELVPRALDSRAGLVKYSSEFSKF